MVGLQATTPKGRDFTAKELIERRIRIESPYPKKSGCPVGHAVMVIADDQIVNNVVKIELTIEPAALVEATLTLTRFDLLQEGDALLPTEQAIVRDNVDLSFSAIVAEVRS